MSDCGQPDRLTPYIVLVVECDGEDAAMAGAPRAANPYGAGTWEQGSWARGWIHGACGLHIRPRAARP